jgi:hypothetical protein
MSLPAFSTQSELFSTAGLSAGQGQQKKEHVGCKVQVAESVSEAVLAEGEPTRNFIVGIVSRAAHESDELGAEKMEQEQAGMGLDKPPVQYADGAYVSAQKLAEAQAQGRELIGPAQPTPQKDGRFSVEDFQIKVEERTAICPAGKANTQCSRLEEEARGKVSYQERLKHRNGIEGTQSELVRGHGLRRARYRGLAKVRLQNYFIAAACNVKRWIRREAWKLAQPVSVDSVKTAKKPEPFPSAFRHISPERSR